MDTSFAPTVNSTKVSQGTKRVSKELAEETSKKLKCDEDIGSVINKSLKKCIRKELSSDSFASPNRVVRRKFPGPAGLLPEIGASNKSILQLLESEKLKNDDIDDVGNAFLSFRVE